MPNKKLPKGTCLIDGQLFSIRCPIQEVSSTWNLATEWQKVLAAVGEDKFHNFLPDQHGWEKPRPKSRLAMFRPVLEPLDEETLLPITLNGPYKDGDIVETGAMYLNGVQANSFPVPYHGDEISFGTGLKDLLSWVFWEGRLYCTKPLLSDISWDALDKLRFTRYQPLCFYPGLAQVNGEFYSARCFGPGEHQEFVRDTHFNCLENKPIGFWRQESYGSTTSGLYCVSTGAQEGENGRAGGDTRSHVVGFRPVLEPLIPHALDKFPNGTVISGGYLALGSFPVHVPAQFTPKRVIIIKDGKVTNGQKLEWVVWNGMLVSMEPILYNVSWNDLNEQGLVFGAKTGSLPAGPVQLAPANGSVRTHFKNTKTGETKFIDWFPEVVQPEDMKHVFRVSSIYESPGNPVTRDIYRRTGANTLCYRRTGANTLWAETPMDKVCGPFYVERMDQCQEVVNELLRFGYLTDGSKLYAPASEPQYLIDPQRNPPRIHVTYDMSWRLPYVFRADELDLAIEAALSIRGLADKDIEKVRNTRDSAFIQVEDANCISGPSYQNRSAENIWEMVKDCLMSMFSDEAAGEESDAFSDLVQELATRVFNDPKYQARHCIIDEESELKPYLGKLLLQRLSRL